MLVFLAHGSAIFAVLTLSQVLNGDVDLPVMVPFQDIKAPCLLTIGFLAVHLVAILASFNKSL